MLLRQSIAPVPSHLYALLSCTRHPVGVAPTSPLLPTSTSLLSCLSSASPVLAQQHLAHQHRPPCAHLPTCYSRIAPKIRSDFQEVDVNTRASIDVTRLLQHVSYAYPVNMPNPFPAPRFSHHSFKFSLTGFSAGLYYSMQGSCGLRYSYKTPMYP